ncbi:MAG: RDD family protein [Pseudomonadota bacterium]
MPARALTKDPAMYSPANSVLPDPIRHAEFYDGVPVKRGLAWVVDMILIALITALIVPFTAFTALFFLPVLYLVVGFVYRWVSLSRKSATPGMRLLSLTFLDRQGMAFDPATAFAHTLGYSLSVAFVIPQVISVGMMLISSRAQGLTDIVLGSVAINRPMGG